MKIFGLDVDLGALGRAFGGIGTDSPQFIRWNHGLDYDGVSFSVSRSEAYCQSVWVRRCVNKVAETAASVPMEVLRNDNPLPSHPVLDFLKDPNPLTDYSIFQALTFASLMIYGEAAFVPRRSNEDKRVIQLWQVDPTRLTPLLDYNDDLHPQIGWTITYPSGRQFALSLQDVAFIKIPNPLNPLRGASPLEAAGLAIGGDLAAQKHNIAFFANGAIPAGILSTDAPLQTHQVDQLTAEWDAKHRGVGKAKRPAILHSGLSWTDTQYSNQDMEYQAMRATNKDEILAAFGVPPVLVGDMKDASYANAREQTRLFWTSTIIPLQKLVAAVLTKKLLGAVDPSLTLRFKTSNVPELQMDIPQKLEQAQIGFEMGIPLNELIRALELPFKPQPWGDVGYLSAGLQRAQDAAEPPQPQPAELDPAAQQPQVNPPAEAPALPPARRDGPDYSSVRSLLVKALTPIVSGPEIAIRSEALIPPDIEVRDATPDPLDLIIEAMRSASPVDIAEATKSLYKRALKVGSQQMGFLIGVNYDAQNPAAVDYLKTKMLQIKDIDAKTEEAVREVLADGLARGESNEMLADRLRKLYNFSQGRSQNIAETETASAINTGRYLTMVQAGIESHQWLSPNPKAARHTHQAEHRHRVKIGSRFPVTNLRYPGDPTGKASETIRCKCISLPDAADIRAITFSSEDDYNQYHADLFNKKGQWAELEDRFKATVKSHLYRQRSAALKALADLQLEGA